MINDVNSFLDKLLESKGMVGLPSSIMERARADLLARLEQWLILSFINEIPEKEANKVEAMMENESSIEEIMEYIQQVVPDWERISEEALTSFGKTYLS